MSQNAQAEEKTQRRASQAAHVSQLTRKVAVVTGAARGIGRAIAVELAANGTASNAKPATEEDTEETAPGPGGRQAQPPSSHPMPPQWSREQSTK
jgi:hypothetical protein